MADTDEMVNSTQAKYRNTNAIFSVLFYNIGIWLVANVQYKNWYFF
jgi:hypothetical protein